MGYKIIQALTALYVKLGGTAADVANITTVPEMIKAIAGLDIGGGGGEIADGAVTTSKIADANVTEAKLESTLAAKVNATELPAVTTDDNGSVLLVAEGEWGKGSVPAPASNDFVVTYTDTYDEQTETTVHSADKTFAEITAAIEAGKNVKAVSDNSYYYLSYCDVEHEVEFLTATYISGPEGLDLSMIIHKTDNTIITYTGGI